MLPGWTVRDLERHVESLRRDEMMSRFDAEILRGQRSLLLGEDRLRVGRIIVATMPIDDLKNVDMSAVVDRVLAMTPEDVRAFLELHALDRTVNG